MAEFPVKWMSSDMQGAPVLQYGEIGSLKALLEAVLVTGFGTTTIDTLTYDSEEGEGIIEITAGHSFKQHQIIEIAGADQAEYNGQWRVSSVTSTLIRFAMDAVPSENGTGSITVKVPSPGWTMPFESGDGNRAVFKPASNAEVDGGSGMYWYIDNTDHTVADWSPNTSSSYHYAFIAGYEDVADIDTRFGELHGNDALYALRYFSGYTRDWVAIVDERTIYLHVRDEDGLSSTYSHATILSFGDVISHRRPDLRDAFLNMQYAPSTGNSFTNYFYSPSNVNGRVVSHGGYPEDRNAGMRYIGVAENAYTQQTTYPGYTGKVMLRPIAVGAKSPASADPFLVGLLPGVYESLSGPCFVHRHVAEQEGKLLMAIRHDPGNKSYPSVSMHVFDLTGPWQ